MDYPADLEQCVQIPSQPGSCGQLFQDPFGLKIEHILGADLRGGLSDGVVELHRGCDRLIKVFIFVQEHKDRFAHRDSVAVAQTYFRHRPSFHERSVAAFEVANLVGILLAAKHAVASRQGEIADGERIGWISPNPDLGIGQEISGVGQGSRGYLKSGFHWFAPRSCIPFTTIADLPDTGSDLVPLSEQIENYLFG